MMRAMWLIILLFSSWAQAFDYHEMRLSTPAYLELAHGGVGNKNRVASHPWPVQVQSIGHTNASYQNYGGEPYFHHGLDIRANAGEDVFASTSGRVVNIENYAFGDLYWEVAILDEQGFIWQYHHVDRHSIPRSIHDALRSGATISAGTKIGKVVSWPTVTFGERYHHIHLNVLDGEKRYVSPFLLLDPLPDHEAPVIQRIGLLKDNRELSGSSVRGAYSLFAEITDLVLHTRFVVPPHLIELEIDGAPLRTLWDFSQLPGGTDEEARVHDFFVPRMVCGNYSCRRIIINLGFDQSLPTTPGVHNIRVHASDFAGHRVSRDFQWTVENHLDSSLSE